MNVTSHQRRDDVWSIERNAHCVDGTAPDPMMRPPSVHVSTTTTVRIGRHRVSIHHHKDLPGDAVLGFALRVLFRDRMAEPRSPEASAYSSTLAHDGRVDGAGVRFIVTGISVSEFAETDVSLRQEGIA